MVVKRWATTLFIISSSAGFQPCHPSSSRNVFKLHAGNENKGFPNPLKGISDMISNMDDVIDDFMSKRMGNGEVFYDKRKYQPSERPNTEGRYNGMGMSDKLKIDVTREVKEEMEEAKRQKQKERD